MKFKFYNKTKWCKLVSPISDNDIAPFNWYSFKHRFGSKLVLNIFDMFGLEKGDTVFDPFCGGGTTLITANLEGINSVGLDISPLSVFLSKALTTRYDGEKLRTYFDRIEKVKIKKVKIPDVDLLGKAFSKDSLKYIYNIKRLVSSFPQPNRNFYLLGLLSILNSVSKAKKAGGFLRITEQKRKNSNSIKTALFCAFNKFIEQLINIKYTDATVKIRSGDARCYPADIKNVKYDAIITSPPYPNRHDYTRIYQLELLLGFIDNNDELKSIRYKTLRSHVEARKQHIINDYIMPSKLKQIINLLNKKTLNNCKIVEMITGYFEDMHLAIKEMASVVKENGKIALVVCNVRFAGIVIPVDELLAEIGVNNGLKCKGIYILRYKGNSAQQMREYKKEPVRESLIIWSK